MSEARKSGWAIKSASPEGAAVTLAFAGHDTPEQAIEAYVAYTGKPWAECVKEGATLVRVDMVERRPPTSRGNDGACPGG